MFDVSTVITKLYGEVGLKQPFNPTYAILDTDNITSRSGLYANRTENPYVKIQYLKECQDYVEISDAEFNQLLKEVQEGAIISVCNDVFSGNDARQSDMIYSYALNKVNTSTMPTGWVGYKLTPNRDKDVALEIDKVILDFVGTGDITIQLYDSNKREVIFEQLVSITGTTQVQELNWVVNNSGDTYKGELYFGYVSNPALTPYKRDYEQSDIKNVFNDFYIEDIYFPNHTGNEIFDLTADQSIDDYVGLNPSLVVYDDYTDTIIKNRRLFSRAIDLQFQIALMRMYQGSLRSNRDQRKANDLFNAITVAIQGLDQEGSIKVQGALSKLNSEIIDIKREIFKVQDGLKTLGVTTATFE